MELQTGDVLTVQDVADYLRVPASSVYKLAQDGKLPAIKVGRHWRFLRSTLAEWLAEQARLQSAAAHRTTPP